MVRPHLLSGYGGIALQLLDCLIGNEASCFQPTDAQGEQGEPDQQSCPTYDQARPTHGKPGSGQAGNCCLEQNHQSRDQQHRTSDNQPEPHTDLTELLRYLDSGELAFLPDQRRKLVHQIDKDH
jgi:hypothetical protein